MFHTYRGHGSPVFPTRAGAKTSDPHFVGPESLRATEGSGPKTGPELHFLVAGVPRSFGRGHAEHRVVATLSHAALPSRLIRE